MIPRRENAKCALLAAHEEQPPTSMHLVTLTPELLGESLVLLTSISAWQWLLGHSERLSTP
jgi:hypothetical protein